MGHMGAMKSEPNVHRAGTVDAMQHDRPSAKLNNEVERQTAEAIEKARTRVPTKARPTEITVVPNPFDREAEDKRENAGISDQCEETAKKKTEAATRATTPWPFPFSLLQMGNLEAARRRMLTEIDGEKRACVQRATKMVKK